MKKVGTIAAVTLGCLVSGALLVGATQGSELDPLVTLSYLSDVLTPSILEQVDTKVAETQSDYTTQLDQAIVGYETQMDEKLSQTQGDGQETTESAVFQTVSLTKGQSLTLSAGGEFILRAGTATCAATPEMLDNTSGEMLAKGEALVSNHLYLLMSQDTALTATSAVTVLVRGTYSVG